MHRGSVLATGYRSQAMNNQPSKACFFAEFMMAKHVNSDGFTSHWLDGTGLQHSAATLPASHARRVGLVW